MTGMPGIDPLPQSQTMKMLERALDLYAERHQVLLANVANEETPGYKAKDLEFRSVLAAVGHPDSGGGQMRPVEAPPHPRHLPLPGGGIGTPGPTEVIVPSASSGLDRNTVSIEKTMAAMNQNGTMYAAASQILSRKYQGLISAMRDLVQ
jgi:flagellar basal-body rod protein FlgB